MTHQHASISRLPALLSTAALLLVLSPAAFGQCGELIRNGDFEAGNTEFTTRYTYNPYPDGLWETGTYNVLRDPTYGHSHFGGVDHTSGTGMLMALNGSGVINRKVWSQTVDVLPGTRYVLSAWVNTLLTTDNSPAVLKFLVNSVQVGSNYTGPSTGHGWAQFSETCYSGDATEATIQINNMNPSYDGNDFGLDDISFKKIDETAPTVTVASGLTMWPPNHEYHYFPLSQLVTNVIDDCDNAPMLHISAAGSDEAENASGLGDGDTWDDIVIAADCRSVMLRAERQGGGNGRVYTVYVSAMDASGNTRTVECHIAVRHNSNGSATDDGVISGYEVTGACGTSAKGVAKHGTPTGFALEQNSPNPFNPSTEILFHAAEDSELRLTVLDALGRQVSVLAEGTVTAGTHSVIFQADNLPSGLYFYRLESQGRAITKRMMLMK